MGRIQEIAFLVFGQLAVGGVFLLSLPSLETVGLGFFRTNGLVFLITVLLGMAVFPVSVPDGPTAFFGVELIRVVFLFFSLFALTLFIYNLRLWFRHPHHSRKLLLASASFGVIAIVASVGYYLPQPFGPIRAISLSIYFVISSLLLGAGVLAMLLGHSYLTRPSLSIVPLRNLAKLFMVLVFIEAALAIINLLVMAPFDRLRNALLLNTFEGLYLWIRLLIGIVGPLILAPMILQTVKERATMSATGLLYVAMMMVIIGEIFSRFFLLVDAAFL
jgi:protein NrfD